MTTKRCRSATGFSEPEQVIVSHEVVSMRRLCIVKATVVARAVADR